MYSIDKTESIGLIMFLNARNGNLSPLGGIDGIEKMQVAPRNNDDTVREQMTYICGDKIDSDSDKIAIFAYNLNQQRVDWYKGMKDNLGYGAWCGGITFMTEEQRLVVSIAYQQYPDTQMLIVGLNTDGEADYFITVPMIARVGDLNTLQSYFNLNGLFVNEDRNYLITGNSYGFSTSYQEGGSEIDSFVYLIQEKEQSESITRCLSTLYEEDGSTFDSFSFSTVNNIELGDDIHLDIEDYESELITSKVEAYIGRNLEYMSLMDTWTTPRPCAYNGLNSTQVYMKLGEREDIDLLEVQELTEFEELVFFSPEVKLSNGTDITESFAEFHYKNNSLSLSSGDSSLAGT